MAATRGRLMELLAAEIRPGDAACADQAFMVGIMSLMPVLVGQPIAEIVAPLGLAEEVKAALCTGSGLLGELLALAECSESGDVDRLRRHFESLPGLGLKALNRAQTEALQWTASIGQDKAG